MCFSDFIHYKFGRSSVSIKYSYLFYLFISFDFFSETFAFSPLEMIAAAYYLVVCGLIKMIIDNDIAKKGERNWIEWWTQATRHTTYAILYSIFHHNFNVKRKKKHDDECVFTYIHFESMYTFSTYTHTKLIMRPEIR